MLLIFLLLLVTLAGVLWGVCFFVQGYLYTEPTPQLYWRGPAAAAVVVAYLAIWTSLAYRNPGDFNTIFEFTSGKDETFPRLMAIKKGQKIPYESRKVGSRTEYFDSRNGRPFTRSDSDGIVEAIVVEDKEKQEIRFVAELKPDGNFKDGMVRYVEDGGGKRVMSEARIGTVTTRRFGLAFLNIGLNLLHFVIWFLALWLLPRFQWMHAMGLAAVAWLLMTFVMPRIFAKADTLGRERAASATLHLEPKRGKRGYLAIKHLVPTSGTRADL